MGNAKQFIGVIVGCVVLIGLTCANAQDWPQWRGVNRDGKAIGFKAPATWPKELTQKWKTTVGLGDATPALVGDNLYVFTRQGDDEVTLCLNAADGKELWQNKYAAQAVTGAPGRHPGPRSSPTVAEGKVVTLGVGGVLSCLDAATGKKLWRKDEFPKIVPQFFTAMSPIVVDGMCIAHLGGKDNGAIMAFDLTTGEVKWKWAGQGPGYASPVLLTVDGAKQIVTLTEKSVVAVAVADGKLSWEIPFEPKGRAYNASTPIVDGKGVFFAGAGRGTKAVKVEKQGDAFAPTELWSAELAPQYNSLVLSDGLLYGLSEKGNLYCLVAQSGKEVWTGSEKFTQFGSIVDASPVLAAMTENAGLIVFKPNAKQYEEVARYKVSETPIYAQPVIAGNRIFVKDKETVTLWSVE